MRVLISQDFKLLIKVKNLLRIQVKKQDQDLGSGSSARIKDIL